MSASQDSLDQLAGWAGPLIERLGPAARRSALAEVAQYLRGSQSQRIASQRNPDGTPYEARRPRDQRSNSGRIRRTMFQGLRKARNLQRRATADSATVSMRAQVSRVARVHQEGLRDKVDWRQANSPSVRYARRELLGVSESDRERITDILLQHIAGRE